MDTGGEALDLTGGMDPASDEVTAKNPAAATYREGVSLWLWDDAGRFAFPRIGVEGLGSTWSTSFGIALCMAMPGGQLFVVTNNEQPLPTADGRGRPRVFGAGPLRFECIEPFLHWRVTFEGQAPVADTQQRIPIALSVEAHMVTPPWVQGTFEPDGHHVVGEHRFEQLCAVTGTVSIDGDTTPFTGGGLRIHRKGGNRSDYRDFYGHNWQSARFPSGRAFGFMHYRPRPDGSVKYREGWVLDGDEPLPAYVEDTPWLTHEQPCGEDVSFTLRTPRGNVSIAGETFVSSFRPPRPVGEGATFPLLQSGIARYRWDEETAYGMIERSARL